jgi:hypothetical protein
MEDDSACNHLSIKLLSQLYDTSTDFAPFSHPRAIDLGDFSEKSIRGTAFILISLKNDHSDDVEVAS